MFSSHVLLLTSPPNPPLSCPDPSPSQAHLIVLVKLPQLPLRLLLALCSCEQAATMYVIATCRSSRFQRQCGAGKDNAQDGPCIRLQSWSAHVSDLFPPSARAHRTMRFGSTAKILAKCRLKYYRISECIGSACCQQLHAVQNDTRKRLYIR